MSKKYMPQDESVFDEIVTVAVACKRWNVGRSTLLYSIDTGRVTGRKIGRDWLVTVASMEKRYGKRKPVIRR